MIRQLLVALGGLALSACTVQSLVQFPIDAGAVDAGRADAGSTADAGLSCTDAGVACGGQCIDVKTNDDNCGACGASCTSSDSCANGQCFPDDCPGADCAANQVCVGNRCTETSCVGVICEGGAICHEGRCLPPNCGATTCPTGAACLNGACTDIGCLGVVCQAGLVCKQGACVSPPAGCDGGVAAPDGGFDFTADLRNCGACGNVCPTPANAMAACRSGVCGRTVCNAGFFDIFRDVPGCETACVGATCTLVDGGTLTLSAPPIAETGNTFKALASGGSFGSAVQTNAMHTNQGTLGQATPPGVGAQEQRSANYRNQGGFDAVLKR